MKNSYNLKYVWTISLVAAMGGLLFGYDFVVIGGAKLFYEKYFNLTSAYQVSWANSCALVGCLIGAVISGGLSDKFGRKILLIFSALLFTVTSIGTGMANVFYSFVAWRLLGGVAIGLASNLSPMYIAEISPAQM
ncbi:MAG: MFS transporter, partial [Thermoguttaceae bacterium]